MNKKVMSSIFVMFFALTVILSGCAKNDTKEQAPAKNEVTTKAVRVAIVHGPLGDMGFVDEAHKGIENAKKELGIEYDYVEIMEASEKETQIRMFADAGEYDLVMAVGADYADALTAVAADYPEQKFSLVDGKVEGVDNVHAARAFDQEQTFLSGVLAGLVTKDERMKLANSQNIIGFVGGMDTPASRAGAVGFMAGVKYVNPEAEIIYNIIGDYSDPGKGKEIAMTIYGRGADVISHNCGGSGLGVFKAAQEINQYVIGSSLATVDPEHSLCTSVKKTDLFVYQEIEDVINGNWKPGTSSKGLKEGVCNYDLTGINTEIPEDLLKIVEKVKQEFLDDKITLPNDPDELAEWSKNNQFSK